MSQLNLYTVYCPVVVSGFVSPQGSRKRPVPTDKAVIEAAAIGWCCYDTENPIYVFPEMKLCGLVLNSYIHVSVSDLNISQDQSAYLATAN